jgi:hypothetical protein
MGAYILILILSTSPSSQSGAAGVAAEFTTHSACAAAGASLVAEASRRGNFVLSWGCYPK